MSKSQVFLGTALTVVFVLMASGPAAAQTLAPGTAASATKAQRAESRKEARAQRNAELKRLEKNGYNPAAGTDPHYPDDIQNAEKKAGGPGAAGQ